MEQHKVHNNHNHKKKKEFNNKDYIKLYMILGIVLIVFTIFNIAQGLSFEKSFDQNIIQAKEDARPGEIELITINSNNCKDCFDISTIVSNIQSSHVNITKEETLDMESVKAKELIKKYEIKKIPTVLVFGELNKTNIGNLEEKEDALVFRQLTPVYIDIETNKIIGKVSSTLIKDSKCENCVDLETVLLGLKQSGIKITEEKVVEYESAEGQNLIDKYGIKIIPTLILSKDLNDYGSEISSSWSNIGSIENDGSYITRTNSPPYLNLETNEIEGLINVIYLEDKSCANCYDAMQFHQPILQRMSLAFEKQERIDISSKEGQNLIDKYSIDLVPTIILQGDPDKYPVLAGAWRQVGSVEDDGTYVFRNVQIARQPYKDLAKNEVISP